MAITYPLTFPSQVPSQITMRLNSVNGVEVFPFVAKVQVQEFAGRWWEFEARFPPLVEADGKRLAVFLGKLDGRKGTFLAGDLSNVNRGTPTGTPVVDGTGPTGVTIPIRGFDPSSTGNLLYGDYVQFGTGDAARLHMILNDSVDGDIAGDSEIDVWPPVTANQSLADGQSLITTDPVGLFRLVSNANDFDVKEARLYSFLLAGRSEN